MIRRLVQNSKLTRQLILFVIICASLLIYLFPNSISHTDNILTDTLFTQTQLSQAPNNITIIDIDDESLQNIAPWPWSRELIFTLLHELKTKHSPKAIGLDMVFPESKNFETDQQLADFIKTNDICISIAFNINSNLKQQSIGEIHFGKEHNTSPIKAHGYIGNYPSLAQTAQCQGHITPTPDEDGLIRKIPHSIEWQGQHWPTLAQSMLVTPNQTDFYRIPYRINPQSWHTISAQAILFNQIDPGLLDNHYILIGSTALGLADKVATPIHPWLAGVSIHAELINELLYPTPQLDDFPLITLLYTLMSIVIIHLLLTKAHPLIAMSSLALLSSIWIIFVESQLHSQNLQLSSLPMIALVAILLIQLPLEWLIIRGFNVKMTRLFNQYLSKPVAKMLIESNIDASKPKLATLTVMFVDIEGYTKLAQKIPPETLAQTLREVLEIMSKAVHKEHGTLDKFIGDAVMAFWNAPIEQDNHADLALQAAINIVKHLNQYNSKHKLKNPIKVRIGIQTGEAMVGDLGTSQRHTYTAIGDTVNKAHRLHEKSKMRDTFILISKETKNHLQYHHQTEQYKVDL